MSARRRLALSLVVSTSIGYVALSQEIVWIRLIAYATGGRAEVFGHVLGVFLLGVAAGALLGKKASERPGLEPLAFIGGALVAAAIVYGLSIPLSAWVFTRSGVAGMIAAYGSIALVAALTGGIFPILCHYGVAGRQDVGIPLSWIYMANILGATAGPLVTGFVLFDRFSVLSLAIGLAEATALLGAAVLALTPFSYGKRAFGAGLALAAAFALALSAPSGYERLLEKLQYRTEYAPARAYRFVASTRNGIVAVEEAKAGDILFGGGVYDGRFNLDPVADSNGITRAYMVAALHPDPAEVLVIGLASGSWTRALMASPRVRHVTAVELNPAYLEIIKRYPQHTRLLDDPRFEIVIDDGRRWLKRHAERRFDFMLMNIYYWQNLATNLLSREFFELCRSRLREGGVIYLNETGYEPTYFTAAQMFRHLTHVQHFLAASDHAFDISGRTRREKLLELRLDGAPVFRPEDPASRAVLERLVAMELPELGPAYRGRTDMIATTDDNMAPEYKSDAATIGDMFNGDKAWSVLWDARRPWLPRAMSGCEAWCVGQRRSSAVQVEIHSPRRDR